MKKKKKQQTKNTIKSYAHYIFFAILLFSGLYFYKDYGVGIDEEHCRNRGEITVAYAQETLGLDLVRTNPRQKRFEEYEGKAYGVFIDASFFMIEKLLDARTNREIVLTRHIMIFLLFWLSTIAFYYILKMRHEKWYLPLLGCIFLVLSPRIFADSFYNTKDIGFMAMMIFSSLTLLRFLRKKSTTNMLIHAMVTAFTINTRILGLLVPFLTLCFLALDYLKPGNKPDERKQILFMAGGYCIASFMVLYISWPYLWTNPIGNLFNSFHEMSSFERGARMLPFMGNIYSSENLPFYYIPLYIIITTPIFYLVLFTSGIVSFFNNLIGKGKNVVHSFNFKFDILFLLILIIPVLAVIVLNSVLYNGWRQMYFIYAPFILISLAGFDYLVNLSGTYLKQIKPELIKYTLAAIIFINLAWVLIIMVRLHPYQNVYFNTFAGQVDEKRYELDYWGLGFREAAEWCANNDPRMTVLVAPTSYGINSNALILERKYGRRLRFAPLSLANYYMTNYDDMPDKQEQTRDLASKYPEVHAVTADGLKIIRIYRLK